MINRSPSSSVRFLWCGRPIEYDNLRVFSALKFAHVNKDKLEAQVNKCICIGYVEGVKGYKIWRLEFWEARCFANSDATFN